MLCGPEPRDATAVVERVDQLELLSDDLVLLWNVGGAGGVGDLDGDAGLVEVELEAPDLLQFTRPFEAVAFFLKPKMRLPMDSARAANVRAQIVLLSISRSKGMLGRVPVMKEKMFLMLSPSWMSTLFMSSFDSSPLLCAIKNSASQCFGSRANVDHSESQNSLGASAPPSGPIMPHSNCMQVGMMRCGSAHNLSQIFMKALRWSCKRWSTILSPVRLRGGNFLLSGETPSMPPAFVFGEVASGAASNAEEAERFGAMVGESVTLVRRVGRQDTTRARPKIAARKGASTFACMCVALSLAHTSLQRKNENIPTANAHNSLKNDHTTSIKYDKHMNRY